MRCEPVVQDVADLTMRVRLLKAPAVSRLARLAKLPNFNCLSLCLSCSSHCSPDPARADRHRSGRSYTESQPPVTSDRINHSKPLFLRSDALWSAPRAGTRCAKLVGGGLRQGRSMPENVRIALDAMEAIRRDRLVAGADIFP